MPKRKSQLCQLCTRSLYRRAVCTDICQNLHDTQWVSFKGAQKIAVSGPFNWTQLNSIYFPFLNYFKIIILLSLKMSCFLCIFLSSIIPILHTLLPYILFSPSFIIFFFFLILWNTKQKGGKSVVSLIHHCFQPLGVVGGGFIKLLSLFHFTLTRKHSLNVICLGDHVYRKAIATVLCRKSPKVLKWLKKLNFICKSDISIKTLSQILTGSQMPKSWVFKHPIGHLPVSK